jgi:hypothetical protein
LEGELSLSSVGNITSCQADGNRFGIVAGVVFRARAAGGGVISKPLGERIRRCSSQVTNGNAARAIEESVSPGETDGRAGATFRGTVRDGPALPAVVGRTEAGMRKGGAALDKAVPLSLPSLDIR